MKILLTNDDGIDAPGLRALSRSVRQALGDKAEITVIAPDRCRSECGHSVTSGRPLRLHHHDEKWISIDGTPVDCVRAALTALAPDVDMVLSGVNAGANLGLDLLVSGTFAAAREASLHGIAAMAVSHYRHPNVPSTWEHVPDWIGPVLTEFASVFEKREERHPMLWNVNLPAIDPTSPAPVPVRCKVDSRPHVRTSRGAGTELQLESDFHARPRETGSDVERCFGGQLTISELTPRVV